MTTRAAGGWYRRGWMLYLAVYVLGVVPYVFIPSGPVGFAYFQVFAWSGVLMMVARLLRRRPRNAGALWLLAAAQAGTATGVFVLAFFMADLPGPQDAFFLLGSCSQVAGMVWLVRR